MVSDGLASELLVQFLTGRRISLAVVRTPPSRRYLKIVFVFGNPLFRGASKLIGLGATLSAVVHLESMEILRLHVFFLLLNSVLINFNDGAEIAILFFLRHIAEDIV